MNVTITMDDNGNPIFSQEGTVDLDSLVSQLFADNKELKSIVSDKMEAIMDSIKVDPKQISDSVMDGFTKLFTFSEAYTKDIQKTIKTKVEKMLDSIVIDKKAINKNIMSLFEYKDKDKQLKSVFDKINASVSSHLEGIGKGKGKAKKDSESDIITAAIVHIDPNALKAVIMDANIMDVDEGILKIVSNVLSDDQTKKTKEFLEPHLITLTNLLSPQQGPQPEGSNDTVFENEAQPVKLMDIAPELIVKLGALMGGGGGGKGRKGEGEEGEEEEVKKSGGILGFIGNLLGLGGLGKGLSSGGIMGSLTNMFKLSGTLLKFATNPITLLAAGLIWAVMDGIKGFFKADEWGVSKTSGVVGGILGGMDSGVKGALKGMGKWALIGAGIGSFIPVVGTIIGALIGAIVGAIMGWVGGEKIAKGFDAVGIWFKEKWTAMTDAIKTFYPKFKKAIANFIPSFIKELIGMDEAGNITLGNSQIAKDYEKRGFVGGTAMLFARASDVIRRGVAAITPQFIKDLIGMDENGVIDIEQSQLKSVYAEKGFKGGTIFLLQKAHEKFLKGVASITPQFIKDLIGMDENGVIDIYASDSKQLIEEKGWKGGIKEILKRIKDGILKNLAKILPDFVLDFIGLDAEGNINIAESGAKKTIDIATQKMNQGIDVAKQKVNEGVEKSMSWLGDKWDKIASKTRKLAYGESGTFEKATEGVVEISTGEKRTEEVQDLVVNYKNPRAAQFQLDGKDKLETLGDTNVYSKQGGTLDKAMGEMKRVLEKQLVYLNGMAVALEKYLVQVANNTFAINEAIPQLNMGHNEAPIPAEQSIPDGYIRDPIYEYRMKIRELMV